MSRGIPGYFALAEFGISPADVTRLVLRSEPDDIPERVIVTPDWRADFLADVVGGMEMVSEDRVYRFDYGKQKMSLVRSGVGSPLTGDVILALGCTPCRYLVFTGSFGGLSDRLSIGDLMNVTESISGDGYSNYLRDGELSPHTFLMPARPDSGLNTILAEHGARICPQGAVALHTGRVFSTDTLVGEFAHLDTMTRKCGCIGVEMETAAVFNAAALVGIRAAALLMVSDTVAVNRSLFSGFTIRDRDRCRHVRKVILSRIVLDTLSDSRLV